MIITERNFVKNTQKQLFYTFQLTDWHSMEDTTPSSCERLQKGELKVKACV